MKSGAASVTSFQVTIPVVEVREQLGIRAGSRMVNVPGDRRYRRRFPWLAVR